MLNSVGFNGYSCHRGLAFVLVSYYCIRAFRYILLSRCVEVHVIVNAHSTDVAAVAACYLMLWQIHVRTVLEITVL